MAKLCRASLITWVALLQRSSATAASPEIHYNMTEIVKARGYPIDVHPIETKDGYILTAFRIPHGASESEVAAAKPVVFLQHALMASSFDWVVNPSEQALGYILADAGFDVWFGNNRGNPYGLGHKTLDSASNEFWDFSFDEMALYDLPAAVDYVLGATGQKSLSYIGHSQGTTQAFAGFSHDPELAAKINLFIAMAPVAFVHNQESPMFSAMARFDAPKWMARFGMHKLFVDDGKGNGFANKASEEYCDAKLLGLVCLNSMSLATGPTSHIDSSKMSLYFSHTPAGTSIKNLEHWLQHVRNDVFQMHDYESASANTAKYGTATPPPYDLTKLHVPIALFTGGHDLLVSQKDLDHLLSTLPSDAVVHHKNVDDFAHLDWIWAEDAYKTAFPEVIDLLKKYSAQPTVVV